MFGRKREGREAKERPPFNPRSRVSLYAMGGLYLGYLLYQLVGPYLGEAGTAPSVPTLLLGILVLGGSVCWRCFGCLAAVWRRCFTWPGKCIRCPFRWRMRRPFRKSPLRMGKKTAGRMTESRDRCSGSPQSQRGNRRGADGEAPGKHKYSQKNTRPGTELCRDVCFTYQTTAKAR